MVNVSYNRSCERYIITLEGHANHGPEGKDAVCAAVSILAFAMVRTICNFDTEGGIYKFYCNISKGSVHLDFCVKKWCEKEVRASVDALFEGLYLLEEKFPEHVRVE